MSDTKMLQAIISGQSAIKEELLNKIESVDKKVDNIGKGVVNNGKRMDKLGLQLAELADDASTREDHEILEKRVGKVEKQVASN